MIQGFSFSLRVPLTAPHHKISRVRSDCSWDDRDGGDVDHGGGDVDHDGGDVDHDGGDVDRGGGNVVRIVHNCKKLGHFVGSSEL